MSEKPRHLLHVFSTFAVGGAEIRFTRLANAFGRRYRHTIIAMDGNTAAASLLDPGLDVTFHSLSVEKRGGFSLANFRAFRRTLATLRPDLLLTYNWGAAEWGLANRWLPYCRHLHFEDGFGPDESDGRQIPRRVWFRRLALSGPTTIIVPSRTLETIATRVWRFSSGRIRYIANGVAVSVFDRQPDEQTLPALRRARGELLIGNVGGLRKEKNVARLIRCFAALRRRDARLILVGDGPEREALQSLAQAEGVGDRVVFLGRVNGIERVYRAFDLFVNSSDTEQMPLTLLEAMAAERAVVATDVGDVRAILGESNGAYVVPVQDEAALTRSMAHLLDDAALRATLGRANRARVESVYAETAMFDTYRRLFDDGG
jgi:glycosyltransferase involved in cell wall biosynthesis